MNSGSALFPNGSASAYGQSARAYKGINGTLVWIAAPIAVAVVGGALYVSTAHQTAPSASPTTKTAGVTATTPAALQHADRVASLALADRPPIAATTQSHIAAVQNALSPPAGSPSEHLYGSFGADRGDRAVVSRTIACGGDGARRHACAGRDPSDARNRRF